MGVEGLAEQIELLRKTVDEAVPEIRKDITHIINNNVKSIHTIETVLDQLLGYISLGTGLAEFRQLNTYYAKVDPKKSSIYDNYLKEMYTDS